METKTSGRWFKTVEGLTRDLVKLPSVSPNNRDENKLAEAIVAMLMKGGLAAAYASDPAFCRLEPIPGDPYDRHNALALLPGRRRDCAIVLLGHFDTVDCREYASLMDGRTTRSPATIGRDPAFLARKLASEILDHPEEWMFGRGALDMKSGVAVNIAIMRHFAERALKGDPPPVSLIFAATPDEEVQSAGALGAIAWLARYRQDQEQRGTPIRYIGLINTDNIEPRFPGDAERPLYIGSVGKLLPLFYIVGREAHVGFPYKGVDAGLIAAEIVRDLSMNTAYVDIDEEREASTPPPVTLKLADLKDSYNVKTASDAWCYLNVLTLTLTPGDLLRRLTADARRSLDAVLARLAGDFRSLNPGSGPPKHLTEGTVLTYAELLDEVRGLMDPATLQQQLETARRAGAGDQDNQDTREATLRVVKALWALSGHQGPAVVICYAPPFYPCILSDESGPFVRAVRTMAQRYADQGVFVKPYFPALSDMSYMTPARAPNIDQLVANMPLWTSDPNATGIHYSLPFEAIRDARIEGVVDIGPFGHDAHHITERVHMPYSFETVPQMVYETILEVAELA